MNKSKSIFIMSALLFLGIILGRTLFSVSNKQDQSAEISDP